MILINKVYSVDKDSHNWILNEITTSTAKSGKNKGSPITRKYQRYFPNFTMLCRYVVEHSIDPSGGMETMLASLQQVHRDIQDMISAQCGEGGPR